MILVEETPSDSGGWSGSPNVAVGELNLDVDRVWRNDVALEMWIDAASHPVAIRLAGVLDESTGANLLGVVEDCVAQGQLDFDLDTSAVRIDSSGVQVIDRLRARIHDSGGRLRCAHA